MKRLAFCVLVMLIGAAAVLPLSASAGTGLQILMFVSPTGRAANQTVDVNLESYLDGTATDINTFDVLVGYNGTEINFTKTATGKYHASYKINASDFFYGSLSFHGSAGIGGLTKTVLSSYEVAGGSAGWDVTLRVANFDQVGLAVAPGATVTLEARSYLAGTLADGGPINMTVDWMEGMTAGNATLVATKAQDGVYQATVQVPADLAVSRQYSVEASLGSGFLAPSASAGFAAHPTPVFAVVTASSASAATLKVFVGLAAPVSGANVTLNGMAFSLTYPFTPTVLGPFSATTDANGQATLNPTWGLTAASIWALNVSAGGKLTTLALTLGAGASTAWQPTPAFGFGCEVNLQTDPTGLGAGQTATLVFQVTYAASFLDPQPVASDAVDRYLWRDGEGATALGGSAMTDATGNFTVSYAIPANWASSDELRVQVACPSGSTGSTRVSFGSFMNFESSTLSVTASGKLGGAVQVTATYSGSNPLTGASAYAAIVPGNKTSVAGVGLAGGALSTGLVRAGSTFTGSVNVPAWLGEGDYVVLVIVTNNGATSSTADQTTEGNGVVIHLTPAGSTGGGVTPKGFLPGFEGLAAVAAVGAGAAIVAIGRRRRVA